MKKKKPCESDSAQGDVLIQNGFTENLQVIGTSIGDTMASESLKNRDMTSLSPVNGEIIENLSPEKLHEKLGTKPKYANDSYRLELVKYSKHQFFSKLNVSFLCFFGLSFFVLTYNLFSNIFTF